MFGATTSQEPGAVGRTPADVSVLLVELGRALKGWSFYPAGHPARQELLDRTARAFQGELRRNGALGLEIRRGAFWLPASQAPIGPGRLDDLARQLFVRSVRHVVFDAALDATSLAAFLDVLAMDEDALAAAGGFETCFYTGMRHGVQVNEVDYRVLLERRQAAPAAMALPAAAPSASPEEDEADAGDGIGELALELPAALAIREAPLEAVDPREARARELLGMLRELEECDDEERYRDLARQVTTLATARVSDGEIDEGYRALLVLSSHAGDDAKRSYAQREIAMQFLTHLAVGPALEDLLARACAGATEGSLRATGVLLQLGGRGVPRLLEQLEAESDPDRRARLSAVVIAMGEEAVPTLSECIVSGSRRLQRLALRLAGETQNPRLVPSLREALLTGRGEAARDAAQSLVRIGDVSSLEVLAEGLRCPRAEVAALAAYSLGTTGRVLSLGPLVETLARALAGGELGLAREVVRGIGRLGRPEGAPALAELLARGGLLRRKRLREVKLAAISALAHLPGREAETALERASRARDARLREAAQAALQRREQDARPA
ncbi:MAG TPA: HEAT repeat domain-containing protein [Myxococcota bacterium]|nr:HEAT repeat domain-containing protein [Myxococcota bacterium]